jgi:hypothetical protein
LNKQRITELEIVAASPIVHEPGILPFRIVIRDLGDQFVVQTDEDDCRDLINDDYQLESDIETFEHFTGEVIQPADDDPIPGDEIETEDIERSL